MKRVLTAEEMRAVDAASAEHGMPPAVLMENAGAALADEAEALAASRGHLVVMCGQGNNGGDGLVAARKLRSRGRTVSVEVIGSLDQLKGEPARNLKALQGAGVALGRVPDELPVGEGDVVIDALLGTGITRAPEGPYAEAIGRIAAWRASGAKVVAADVPSGLSSDAAAALAPGVVADVTVSFGFLKLGQVLEPGASNCGQVKVADIGIPSVAHRVLKDPATYLLEEGDVRSRLLPRRADSHKGSYGHVLVIAGSAGKTGAAALVGSGALRAGAGLVTVAARPGALEHVMGHAPELMGVELPAAGPLGLADVNVLLEAVEGKQAVVVGPGIERGEETAKLLGAVLEELTIPCVVDADALNALSADLGVLQQAKGDLVLTPHPGEMARLTGKTVGEIQADRVGTARALATGHQVVVVLKGARTVIAREDGAAFINPTGNPGMATAGSGDVLSGVVGALLAQGLSAVDAATVGAFAHGRAGDLAARRTGQLGLCAGDLLEGLCEVWVAWGR